MKIYIGIDPGKNGGVAILVGRALICKKMPENPKDILSLLRQYSDKDVTVILEHVQGLPKMSGGGMFTFGKGYGWLEMALLATGLKTITVRPQIWTKYYAIGTKSGCVSSTEWKNKLKAKAQQLFPKNNFFLWSSDCTLLAEYGRANNFS